MNIVKKILSVIIGFVLLLAITTLCSLYFARSFLSKDNLAGLIGSYTEELIETDDFFNDNNIVYSEYSEYIDTEKFKDILSSMMADYVRYQTGIDSTAKPSAKELEKFMNEIYDKVEEENDVILDRDDISITINEIEEILEEDIISEEDKELTDVIATVFSNKPIIICYVVIGVCIILILVLRGFRKLLGHLGRVAIINSIGIYALGGAIKFLFEGLVQNESATILLDSLVGIANKIALISLIVGIVLIVISIVLKLIKKKEAVVSEQNTVSSIPNVEVEKQIIDNQSTDENQDTNLEQ